MSDTVTAYKGELKQVFSRRSWELLGDNTFGWTLVPDVPKEVKQAVQSQPQQEPETAPAKRGRKSK